MMEKQKHSSSIPMEAEGLLEAMENSPSLKEHIFRYYHALVGEVLRVVPQEKRKIFFLEFLKELFDGGIRWDREGFFTMQPLKDIGMTSEELTGIILESSGDIYWATFNMFRERRCFNALELDIDVEEYINWYFKGAMIYSGKSVFDEIRDFCAQYDIPAKDVVFQVPVRYYLKSASGKRMLDELVNLPGEKIPCGDFVRYIISKNGYPDEEDYGYKTVMSIYQDFYNDSRGPFPIIDKKRIFAS